MKKLLFALPVVSLLAHAATTYTVTVDVIEDGQDHLVIQGNTLEWIHNSDFANGGVTGGSVAGLVNVEGNTVTANNPYILVSGTDSDNSGLNFTNSDWYNEIQGLQCGTGGGKLTCPYADTAGEFTLPFSVGTVISVGLNVLTKPTFGALNVSQNPNAGNGYTTIVNFDDSSPLETGTHEYKALITLTSIPEPMTLGLCGMGLVAMVWGRRRRG